MPAGTTSTISRSALKKGVKIYQAQTEEDLASIATLFKAYTDSLGIDLTFQSYSSEVAGLPGAYAQPRGSLLLAYDEDRTVLGCLAVRSCPYKNPQGRICEAKRLYVTPAGRGKGVGQALMDVGIANARTAGYSEMRLDTLGSMEAAQRMYRRLGFQDTEPYYDNPYEGTIYMKLELEKD